MAYLSHSFILIFQSIYWNNAGQGYLTRAAFFYVCPAYWSCGLVWATCPKKTYKNL